MNIIYVTNAYHPIIGGVEKCVGYIAHEIKNKGHHIEVVTSRNPPSLLKFEIIDSIPVHRLPFYLYRDSLKSAIVTLLGNPYSSIVFLAIVLKLRPCIVHVQFIYHNAFFIEILRPILNLFHIPVVVTLHGGDAPNISSYYKQNNPSESKILDWTARRLLNNADLVTAVSGRLKNETLEKLPMLKKDIIVIPNGFDPRKFIYKINSEENKIILSIGRLDYQKGFDILLISFEKVSKDYPEWQLFIAGDGQLKDYLKNLANQLKISDRVKFLGMLSTEDLIQQIHESSFVVSASRYEGLSLAALEVLACGKAFISTDVQGADEIIKRNVTGIIIPKENPKEMENAMRLLINNRVLRTELGRNAAIYIGENFTWERTVEKYLALYDDLISKT